MALRAIAELGEEDVDVVRRRTVAEHQVIALHPAPLIDQSGGGGPLRIAQHPGVQQHQDVLELVLSVHRHRSAP